MCLLFDKFFLICLHSSSYLHLFCMTRKTTISFGGTNQMGQLLGPYYILYCSSLHPLLSPRPPFYILESHISLVPITLLRIMNFLCRLLAVTRVLKRGVKRGEKRAPWGLIYVRCQYKQNGKYNLAFSLCGDNGAMQDSNKTQTNICHGLSSAGEMHGAGRGLEEERKSR